MDRDVENHTSDVGHDKQESWPELMFNKIIPLNETGLGGLMENVFYCLYLSMRYTFTSNSPHGMLD